MAFSKIAAENLGGSALPAIGGGNLTGIAGIDGVQVWNMTTAFQGQGSPNYGFIYMLGVIFYSKLSSN